MADEPTFVGVIDPFRIKMTESIDSVQHEYETDWMTSNKTSFNGQRSLLISLDVFGSLISPWRTGVPH